MAHYAFLDQNNIVSSVIVGKSEDTGDWEEEYSLFQSQVCKRTSYNTRGGIHYDPVTNEPSIDQSKSFRKNYAGIGYTYSYERDAFIPPQPYPSWVLDDFSCLWEPPVPYPTDGKQYVWDENIVNWVEV